MTGTSAARKGAAFCEPAHAGACLPVAPSGAPCPLPPCCSRAKELCPHLIVVPYMFEKYEEASEKVSPAAGLEPQQATRRPWLPALAQVGIALPRAAGAALASQCACIHNLLTSATLLAPAAAPVQVYRILLRHTACVQALSCDEAYLDVTGAAFLGSVASRCFVLALAPVAGLPVRPLRLWRLRFCCRAAGRPKQTMSPKAVPAHFIPMCRRPGQPRAAGCHHPSRDCCRHGLHRRVGLLCARRGLFCQTMQGRSTGWGGCLMLKSPSPALTRHASAASAGIGPSPLLARIATDHAKPNGQLAVAQQQARQYLQVSLP